MPWLGKTERPFGNEPRRLKTHASIIRGCELLTEIFKTSLGPRGGLKLVLQGFPLREKVTSDGKTILTSIGTLHPGAWLLRNMAYSQINVGDGVVTTMIFAGELLKHAKRLIDKQIDASIIVHGYSEALRRTLEVLDEISIPVDWRDAEVMRKVAITAAGTKSGGLPVKKLAELGATAVSQIVQFRDGKPFVDIGDICVFKWIGKPSDETRLVTGMVFDQGLRHPAMPKRLHKVKIALLRCGLEPRKVWEEKLPVKVQIGPEKMGSLLDVKLKSARGDVERIVKSGADLVVLKHGCDELHAGLLADRNIQVVHRVPDSGGIGRLAKASGGTAVSTLDDLRPEDLGHAEVAEEITVPRFDTKRLHSDPRKSPDGYEITEHKLFVIDGCKAPRSVTVFVRADVESMVDESERALDASIATCEAIVKDPRIVGGAGSVEAELARRMREFAYTFEDKTQVIVLWYAEALEGVVEALASNAGIDPLDAVLKIRAAHAQGAEPWTGIDLYERRLCDAIEMGVVEPTLIKKSAFKIATEAAIQIVNIDRVLAGDRRPKLLPGEMPWGASEGPKHLTDAKDLPDETIRAFKKSRYIKPYGMKQELNL
ncbi:MAG: hypothetical protein HYY68_08990 [Thaumarchaeota archaeon]|nr:hypothetical protein [Nitrososphaerota archaeon]